MLKASWLVPVIDTPAIAPKAVSAAASFPGLTRISHKRPLGQRAALSHRAVASGSGVASTGETRRSAEGFLEGGGMLIGSKAPHLQLADLSGADLLVSDDLIGCLQRSNGCANDQLG